MVFNIFFMQLQNNPQGEKQRSKTKCQLFHVLSDLIESVHIYLHTKAT